MALPFSLLAVDPKPQRGDRVNVFVHGYRSAGSQAEVEATRQRVLRCGVAGESYLVRWTAGRWTDSAAVAGLRAVYKASRWRYALAPASLLVDAGVVGVYEATQFKLIERRAEGVGRSLPARLAEIAAGRPVNFIGHSLGARAVHYALASAADADLVVRDVVLLAGAADLHAPNWAACLRQLHGRLYNVYSPRDPVLKLTPDLRRRVGSRPLRPVVAEGRDRVVDVAAPRVGHVEHWTRLAELLPGYWPECCG